MSRGVNNTVGTIRYNVKPAFFQANIKVFYTQQIYMILL